MPPDVGRLRYVGYYSLANNLLSGSLGWLNITWLNHLDLSGNSFRGSIPVTYCALLKNISYLNLAENKLVSRIPENIGYLPNLRWLDLSDNKLTGNIPYSLTIATQIKKLRLMNNSLSGKVPDTQTMRLFAMTAFFPGNDGLCGSVLGKECSPSGLWKKIVMGIFLPALILSVLTGILHVVKPPDEYSLRTIRRITDNFNNNKILSVGGLWTIYKGVFFNGKTVAVKRVRPEYYNGEGKLFEEERKFLKAMSHPNIVKYLGACSTPKLKVLVYEHMSNGSLDMHLHKERAGISSLSWSSRMDIAAGVAQGLAYLHGEWKEPQMHCDLNGSSVLLDDKFNARIADIRSKNASKHFTSLETNIGRSTGYHPPGEKCDFFFMTCFSLIILAVHFKGGAEYSITNEPTPEGEVFSFGTLLMELLTGTEAAGPVKNGVKGGLQGIMDRAFPDNLQCVLDPAILNGASHDQIVLCTKIALDCTRTNPEERPKMEHILGMFEQAYSTGPA
ncbi:LRR receptor-like serine/threonine-protein kinase FLS2 [Selaginella moellendorffii]|nr:LRR receptor-like serine/threonine-protein kinase FLS2 [Selaginella moellendorffii]|eukprot:XP_002990733.2 LRR receptor-like serine/threonine-protein kinase FLS2 [Selaginella moellendorffii]